MRRIFGMMPSEEVTTEKQINLNNGEDGSLGKCTVQAGPNGWSVLWGDGGASAKDCMTHPDSNFTEAYQHVLSFFPKASVCFGIKEDKEEK